MQLAFQRSSFNRTLHNTLTDFACCLPRRQTTPPAPPLRHRHTIPDLSLFTNRHPSTFHAFRSSQHTSIQPYPDPSDLPAPSHFNSLIESSIPVRNSPANTDAISSRPHSLNHPIPLTCLPCPRIHHRRSTDIVHSCTLSRASAALHTGHTSSAGNIRLQLVLAQEPTPDTAITASRDLEMGRRRSTNVRKELHRAEQWKRRSCAGLWLFRQHGQRQFTPGIEQCCF